MSTRFLPIAAARLLMLPLAALLIAAAPSEPPAQRVEKRSCDQIPACEKLRAAGLDSKAKGKPVAALEKLQEAYKLSKDYRLTAPIGQLLQQLGQGDEAFATFHLFLNAAPHDDPMRHSVEKWLVENVKSSPAPAEDPRQQPEAALPPPQPQPTPEPVLSVTPNPPTEIHQSPRPQPAPARAVKDPFFGVGTALLIGGSLLAIPGAFLTTMAGAPAVSGTCSVNGVGMLSGSDCVIPAWPGPALLIVGLNLAITGSGLLIYWGIKSKRPSVNPSAKEYAHAP